MTTRELNRDIKRLEASLNYERFDNLDAFYSYIDKEAKREFIRLFNADNELNYMNKESIKIMLKLNLKYRFVALHSFGLNIQLNTYEK